MVDKTPIKLTGSMPNILAKLLLLRQSELDHVRRHQQAAAECQHDIEAYMVQCRELLKVPDGYVWDQPSLSFIVAPSRSGAGGAE
jgi:hypothetical protein